MRPDTLRERARVRSALRAFLDGRGYVEVDAPLLVRGTSPDPGLCSFSVDGDYLTTSTEYAIKRTIAGGLDAVYTLTSNFRKGEVSPTHNPEFTMLEWGRAGATLDEIMGEAEAMVDAVGVETVSRGGRALSLRGPWPRHTVASLVGGLGMAELRESAARLGLEIPPDWDDAATLLSLVLDALAPTLGADGPVWVVEWPSWMTSSTDVGGTFERAELFCGGLELADGFPFLTGAGAGRAAMARALQARSALSLAAVSLDEAYLTSLDELPAGAGMALGFDRLVMLLTGAEHIRDVMVCSWDRR